MKDKLVFPVNNMSKSENKYALDEIKHANQGGRKVKFASNPLIPAATTSLIAVVLMILHRPLNSVFLTLNKYKTLPSASNSTSFYKNTLSAGLGIDLNGPIQGYLAISALVYGLVVAQLYSALSARQERISTSLGEEIGCLHISANLIFHLNSRYREAKKEAIITFRQYILKIVEELGILDITGSTIVLSSVRSLYDTIPELKNVTNDKSGDDHDSIIVDRILDSLNTLTLARHTRLAETNKSVLTALHWIFLHWLVFTMYFGIIFLETNSTSMNAFLCITIMVLMGITSYILADMDIPFTGWVRVSTRSVNLILLEMESMITEISDYH